MAIVALRDGRRLQLSRARGGTVVDVSTTVGGRVPDCIGMTIGLDPDWSGVTVEDILRRFWMTMASCHAVFTYRDDGGEPFADEASDRIRQILAETPWGELNEGLTHGPIGRLARLFARSVEPGDDAATWARLSERLRGQVSDSLPLLGWAFTGVDPVVSERWTETSERNARRWAGPGMLAHMLDDAIGTWDGFDMVFAEHKPRTRTYLDLLPDLDDIVADLAGNRR